MRIVGGDEAPKVNNPVAPIGNVSDMIASEATKIKNKIKIKKKKKKKSVTEKTTTSKDTEVKNPEKLLESRRSTKFFFCSMTLISCFWRWCPSFFL